MARRRVTQVLDQQKRLREIGRIRFGERKPADGKRPGRPLTFPRLSSHDEDAIRQVAEVYGGEVRVWDRESRPREWDVTIQGPLGIAVPPGIVPYNSAYEQWAKGINTVRCDGVTCDYRARNRWTEAPCICAERHEAGIEGYDLEERPCKKTTRILVMVIGIKKLGIWRVDTKSHYASEEVPGMLEVLQLARRAGWMQMRMQQRSLIAFDKDAGVDKPMTRKFPVIAVEADFMPEEIMQLERPASMAALPAPERPFERPQIGAGQVVQPRGPQPHDSEPPPREPPPLDLEPVSGDVVHEGDDEPIGSGEEDPATKAAADAAWEESRPAEQGSLPLDEQRRSAPGDA